jgi:hypothetical protein
MHRKQQAKRGKEKHLQFGGFDFSNIFLYV